MSEDYDYIGHMDTHDQMTLTDTIETWRTSNRKTPAQMIDIFWMYYSSSFLSFVV